MQFSFTRNLAVLAMLVLTALVVPAQTARTRPKVVTNTAAGFQFAHQHGYKAGYDDGFVKGKSDFNETRDREIEMSESYKRADRGYQAGYGTRVEYQEGYRIGFEFGYNDGYFGRPFSAAQPANLRRVVVAAINADSAAAAPAPVATREPVGTPASSAAGAGEAPPIPRARPASESGAAVGSSSSANRSRSARNTELVIRDGTQMKVRLTSEINTKVNKEGDRFTAVVLDPSEYAEAEVTGHIAKLNKAGKTAGKTELSLVFDSIRTRDGRDGRMAAQVEKVYETETVRTVDEEGNVESGSRTKETTTRTVGGAAIGAILGGIAGGGKGAAIGAAIGAGAGVGSVLIQGGKDLILGPGTELLIRTASPARTRE
jgi:hypothetical protein